MARGKFSQIAKTIYTFWKQGGTKVGSAVLLLGRPVKISCAGSVLQGVKSLLVAEACIQSNALPMATSDEVNGGVPCISSGKMKRRICYECGEN
ncbi:hypothetical protein SADUNF_Sadunf08G0039400 [Salix dunnii]|uniref:Uncharacterized protein n=1 Tax=Salix dunnii TaxID=1413687 RepID=A0A835JSU2_9ROSI|nr:hypothetical protein SADUNF_Sadunf08G0039400 [Salix dunnii]